MTTINKINQLATEAADPIVAGEKMRQVFFAQIKLTNRQLTVDFLRKMLERRVGTHEVESLAQRVIKWDGRRNPEVVATLLRIKLKDAISWAQRLKKEFLKKKAELYKSINRNGLIVSSDPPKEGKQMRGVRIANLNPETRMNSCNEFRQGTNITMRPVRGVGV